MSKLSDELGRANTEKWSGREIARRGGDVVHHSTISRWLKGGRGVPDEDTIEVFAKVLNIPRKRLRTLAGLPAGEEEPYRAPDIANRLDERQREVLDLLIHVLAREEEVKADGKPPAKKTARARGKGTTTGTKADDGQ